jgi:UDPglucose 6-dehydrogenase
MAVRIWPIDDGDHPDRAPDRRTSLRVGVLGTGHVGLATCVSLTAMGHEVVGFDTDEDKIALLKRAHAPFHEPGLQELLSEQLALGRLRFVSAPQEAIQGADIVIICVGTPARPDGEADLTAVESAARNVAAYADGYTVVVEKTTVPTGTAEWIKQILRRERPGADVDVASNPEFLREGSAVPDSLKPDRILVGADSPRAFEYMRRLYQPLVEKGCPVIETDIQTAEFAKHACNAFLAMKISYANALARLCERADADVTAVTAVLGADPRIGRSFLNAGLGYGGYCLPKDVQAFEKLATRLGYDFPLLREIERINDEAIEATAKKVEEAVWNLEGKRIALLGLSFKPGTDDTRSAPALALARLLLERGASIVGWDPMALAAAKQELPELEAALDPYDAALGAHCLVLCTEWPEFRELELDKLSKFMAYPIIVDGRNLFDPDQMRAAGFTYFPTGRPPVTEPIRSVEVAAPAPFQHREEVG